MILFVLASLSDQTAEQRLSSTLLLLTLATTGVPSSDTNLPPKWRRSHCKVSRFDNISQKDRAMRAAKVGFREEDDKRDQQQARRKQKRTRMKLSGSSNGRYNLRFCLAVGSHRGVWLKMKLNITSQGISKVILELGTRLQAPIGALIA